MAQDTHHTGGCFCGSVRYTLEGPPLKVGVCHCGACKKLTGGTSWSFAVVATHTLHLTGQVREVTRKADSGREVYVGFCPSCGTTLVSRNDKWPQTRILSVASFDDFQGFSPSFHIWTSAAFDWEIIPEGVHCFPEHIPEKASS